MIRIILSIAFVATFATTGALHADPPKKDSSSQKTKTTSKSAPKIEAANPLASGWSYTNGVWTHVDGYKLVNGQVVRMGTQTHTKPPKPPTKAEMDSVMKKKPSAKTQAEINAEKAAQRERNLAPRPSSQTGTHL